MARDEPQTQPRPSPLPDRSLPDTGLPDSGLADSGLADSDLADWDLADSVAATLRAAGSVFAEDEAALLIAEAATTADLTQKVGRRAAGVPLEQILRWAEFCGLRIHLAPGVFVPRRRTELLVRQALAIVRNVSQEILPSEPAKRSGLSVVDLCCGTGAVGAAVLAAWGNSEPRVDLHAVDLDPVATGCASTNLGGLGQVHTGDLYDALPPELTGRIDILVANAPYVPTDAIVLMPPEARDHEARMALDGGTDGLAVQRRVIAEATRWLAPGGHLLIETSRRQATGTLDACVDAGLFARVVTDDDLDGTAVVATAAG